MVSHLRVKSDSRRKYNSTIPCNPDYTYRHCADLQIVANPDKSIDGAFRTNTAPQTGSFA